MAGAAVVLVVEVVVGAAVVVVVVVLVGDDDGAAELDELTGAAVDPSGVSSLPPHATTMSASVNPAAKSLDRRLMLPYPSIRQFVEKSL